ncbi:unnamed protein product [Orchesella dallaii]|uniref:Meiosis-specific nuclear structural protein 1 n=1 Tax=Orchesella dallaii TaxID=48710 RepID=A0ABP1RG68_9HEXA
MKKLDKSNYKMKKDEMFTRMQIEKNEKDFQDCLCRQEREKERRRGQICTEENFAAAMREMKDEEVRESAFRKQLKNCAPEIRELERQIRRAYYAKTLYAQRLEGDALKLEEKVRERDSYEMMLEQLEKFDQDERDKIQANFVKKKEYLTALKNQMEDVGSKMATKMDEMSKDKAMIDEIINTIKQEELQDLMEKVGKVKLYQSEINHFLVSREAHRERERQREDQEETRRRGYVQKKAEDEAAFKKAKEAQDAVKAGIVARAIERMMKEQFKQEEIEELRQELREEELAAELRQRELDDLARKQRQVIELKAAAEEAIRMREDRLEFERKEEEEYRKQLMEKFAEDERLELMSYQKRRQREREHRKQVEQMIAERRCLRAQEKEKDQHVLDCFNMETERRQTLIDAERLRLLKKHGPQIIGFIPRGVIKNHKELEKLGEPFLSYYKNPPLEPDPTTIDTEPCEEEIFKSMTLPKFGRY